MPAAGRLRRAPPSQIQITFTRRAKDQFSKGERRGGRGRSAALRAGAAASRGGRRGARAAAPLSLPGAAGRAERAPSAAAAAAGLPPGAAALRGAGRGEGRGLAAARARGAGGQGTGGGGSPGRRLRRGRPAPPRLGPGVASRPGRRRPARLPSPARFCAASPGGRCRGSLAAAASRLRKMAGGEVPRAPAGPARPGPGGGRRRADVPRPRAAPGEPPQPPAGARLLAAAARHSR